MTRHKKNFSRALAGLVALGLAAASASTRVDGDLFADFALGWREVWMERAMASRSNTFRVESDDDGRFLRVDSMSSASALWRRVDLEVTPESVISWRWRIAMSLEHTGDERRRENDDYAARVAVMFDGEPFDRSTPFLMYVWASTRDVGDVYPSPYTDKAVTIVVRSGDAQSGEWLWEHRQLSADIERYFGRSAQRITGVALMVDTDNTSSKTTAWFDELTVHDSTSR